MMSNQLEYDPSCSRSRWLGYFDLLGTKKLLRSRNHFQVFHVYSKAVEEATRGKSRDFRIQHAWFSDTFLMYSESDSASDFSAMDMVSRWFVYFLVMGEIPVRGALACGDFYADSSTHLYFGESLVEACDYGEAQDWIGFLLCPSAVARLDAVGLPAKERLNYAYSKIPFKRVPNAAVHELPCCVLGRWIHLNNQNPCVPTLHRMKQKETDDSIIRKYENAIGFIESNGRRIAENNPKTIQSL